MIRVKEKIKRWSRQIAILGVLLGFILSQVATNYFGGDARNILIIVYISCLLCILLILAATSQRLLAIRLSKLFIPLIIIFIGLYIDNLSLAIFGFVLALIMAIIVKKQDRNKDR